MRPVGRLFEVIFLFFERLKGVSTVTEVITPGNLLGSLTGYSVSGHEITIYCRKKTYRRKSKRWWFTSYSESVVYHCYASVTNDAPEKLKQVCQIESSFSPFLPDFISDEPQSAAAIDAYLDILVHRLEGNLRLNA